MIIGMKNMQKKFVQKSKILLREFLPAPHEWGRVFYYKKILKIKDKKMTYTHLVTVGHCNLMHGSYPDL
jgi:hypothetical protein